MDAWQATVISKLDETHAACCHWLRNNPDQATDLLRIIQASAIAPDSSTARIVGTFAMLGFFRAVFDVDTEDQDG